MTLDAAQSESRWPHRWAVLLCCATFPLIWVGGLVTTYDAGMAVPDWPSTYGYNLFLYPWTTWIFGPWDLFIEHGHRLLGAVVGLLTIALAVAIFRYDARRWLRQAALAALALVVLQGSLGGARVLLDDRQLAMFHGCIGPAFFGLAVALAVWTSSLWRSPPRSIDRSGAPRLVRLSCLTTLLAYVQLIIGAQLRHVPPMASASSFQMVVVFHLAMAAVLTLHIVLLALAARSSPGGIRRPALALVALVAAQLMLGLGTWLVKYGVPSGLADWPALAGYTVQARGFRQAMLVTAHVATGSLLIAISLQLALRAWRLARASKHVPSGSCSSPASGNPRRAWHQSAMARQRCRPGAIPMAVANRRWKAFDVRVGDAG